MPKVFEWKGYKFFFFSNENEPLERCHIHVRKDENVAKFWLNPIIALASSWGMTSKELKVLEKIIEENQETIRSKWNEHFSKKSTSR